MATIVPLAVALLESARKQIEEGKLVIEYKTDGAIGLRKGFGSGRRELITHSLELVAVCKTAVEACPAEMSGLLDALAAADKELTDTFAIEPKTQAIADSEAYRENRRVIDTLQRQKEDIAKVILNWKFKPGVAMTGQNKSAKRAKN